MVQGKAKGNKEEILVWRDLQSVFPDIRRISASGSMLDDKGDLESLNFVFEIKHHKKIYPSQVEHWFKEIWRIAEKKQKLPILVCKENYRDRVVYVLEMRGNTPWKMVEKTYEAFKEEHKK